MYREPDLIERTARDFLTDTVDNIICDVTGIDNLQIGDLAGIITDYYTLDDMGRDAGTISYEILSRIGKNTRYIRTYIGA